MPHAGHTDRRIVPAATPESYAMNKPLSIALLIVGVILLIWGLQSSNSVASDVSNAVTGSPTDRSIWLIALGVLAAVIGGFGLLRRAR